MFNQECEHVFQVENSKDNEDSILQREVPARQSRRRFRKINCKGERQTITDDVDINSYLSVSIFRNISWVFLSSYSVYVIYICIYTLTSLLEYNCFTMVVSFYFITK